MYGSGLTADNEVLKYIWISNERVNSINQYLVLYFYWYVTMMIYQKFSFFFDTRKGGCLNNEPLL